VKEKTRTTEIERREAATIVAAVDLDSIPVTLRERAIMTIQEEIAKQGGPPRIGEGSDNRAYTLATRLGDLSCDGVPLSVPATARLMHEHWARHFTATWLLAKARSAAKHRQNDPGCDDIKDYGAEFDHCLDQAEKQPFETTGCVLPQWKPVQIRFVDAVWEILLRPILSLFRSRSEALSRPPPEMLVDGIVPAAGLVLPYRQTGCGKTYFAAEIGTAVAMRRPAFGRFKVNAPGETGLVVMFLGEDCHVVEQSRLVAIEQRYGSLEGLLFTADIAIPLTDKDLLRRYRDELRAIEDIAGRKIDLIMNDTLGRSIAMLNPNDQQTGQIFTAAMDELVREFGHRLCAWRINPRARPARSPARRCSSITRR
jgi:hypothetical protein